MLTEGPLVFLFLFAFSPLSCYWTHTWVHGYQTHTAAFQSSGPAAQALFLSGTFLLEHIDSSSRAAAESKLSSMVAESNSGRCQARGHTHCSSSTHKEVMGRGRCSQWSRAPSGARMPSFKSCTRLDSTADVREVAGQRRRDPRGW
jgi:hypothetical protein